MCISIYKYTYKYAYICIDFVWIFVALIDIYYDFYYFLR